MAFCVYRDMKNNSFTWFAIFVLCYIGAYIYYQYKLLREIEAELIYQEEVIRQQQSLIKAQQTYIIILEDMNLSPIYPSTPNYKMPI